MTAAPPFDPALRRAKCRAFDLEKNSTAKRVVPLDLWGTERFVYANANLSVYSAEACNARCTFCVEELRPASRGLELATQKVVLRDDGRYFAALERVLEAVRPLDPSVSVTGGEPSRDPRLPSILRRLAAAGARKRTLTTNGSGLLDVREGRRVIDWIAGTGVSHLNVSRASVEHERNARLMRYDEGPDEPSLRAAVSIAEAAGTRVRLSCVLLRGETESVDAIVRYVDFARSLGVRNVIFRQLMKTDPRTVAPNHVVLYGDRARVALEPLLDALSVDPRFTFERQIVGYYYYVEVFRYDGVDVVFEEADLAALEDSKRATPGVVHELVFHPDGKLASTWQPWDDVLGPPG